MFCRLKARLQLCIFFLPFMFFFLEAQIQQKNKENKMRTKIYININFVGRKSTEYYFKLRLRTGC